MYVVEGALRYTGTVYFVEVFKSCDFWLKLPQKLKIFLKIGVICVNRQEILAVGLEMPNSWDFVEISNIQIMVPITTVLSYFIKKLFSLRKFWDVLFEVVFCVNLSILCNYISSWSKLLDISS